MILKIYYQLPIFKIEKKSHNDEIKVSLLGVRQINVGFRKV